MNVNWWFVTMDESWMDHYDAEWFIGTEEIQDSMLSIFWGNEVVEIFKDFATERNHRSWSALVVDNLYNVKTLNTSIIILLFLF